MLTSAQLVVLKAAIMAETDSAVVTARGTRHDYAIMMFYNDVAPGPVKLWRNNVTQGELVEVTIENIAQFDNLTAGKRDAWNIMFQMNSYDFTRNKIRSAPGKVWDATQRDAILNGVGIRNALRCELLFGTSDVTEGTVTAKKCDFMGSLSVGDVSNAMNLA